MTDIEKDYSHLVQMDQYGFIYRRIGRYTVTPVTSDTFHSGEQAGLRPPRLMRKET